MHLGHPHLENVGGNGAKAYACAACGVLMTSSDRLLPVQGSNQHRFINPAGVECDFHTFYACPGAVALGEPTDAHSWFVGYAWRMAFCHQCGQHVGWFYESISHKRPPLQFWGILQTRLLNPSPEP